MKRRQEKHVSYARVIEALSGGGCAVCTIVLEDTRKYLDSLLYERVNDSCTRKELVESRGFCGKHAWQLGSFRRGLGTAILYQDQLKSTVSELQSIGGDMTSNINIPLLAQIVRPKGSVSSSGPAAFCPACRRQARSEDSYLKTISDNYDDPTLDSAYQSADGLCLPHLRKLLHSSEANSTITRLVEAECKKLASLAAELEEFIRKHDYRYSSEGFGAESNSWLRAIEKMAGKEGVF